MRNLFFAILLYPFCVKSQMIADTTYFVNPLGGYIKVVHYRNSATTTIPTTAMIPVMTNYVTSQKLTDSLNAARTLIATKQPAGSYLVANDITGKVNYTDSSGTYQTKYRSDTARSNTYTALAGKQATGNYLTANPNIGTATGTSLAATGTITSSGGGIGYVSGNGGTVTQLTSKSTGVTLNKLTGDITLNGAALAAATIVSFTLTDNQIAATDAIIVQHQATGTFGAYTINGRTAAGSAVISIRNNTAGSLSEAIVIKFTIIKSATN